MATHEYRGERNLRFLTSSTSLKATHKMDANVTHKPVGAISNRPFVKHLRPAFRAITNRPYVSWITAVCDD